MKTKCQETAANMFTANDTEYALQTRAFRFGWKKFDSIRFDSTRQFDKMDACIGVMIFLSIAEFLFSNQ